MPKEAKDIEETKLSEAGLNCLRTMVAWDIVGRPSFSQDTLDNEFGRDVWTEVALAKPNLMRSEMYGCHSLTSRAVFVAMGWSQ